LKISLGTIKDQGEELAAFLEPRVGVKPSVSGDALEVEDGSIREGVRPRHVKTYIKRFMYMKGIKKKYRVFVSGKELTIQEIELGEEKEKEEKKHKEEAAKAPSKEKSPEEKEEPAPEKAPEEPKPEKKAAPKKPSAKKKKKSESETSEAGKPSPPSS
jgi:sRNA-binding protein